MEIEEVAEREPEKIITVNIPGDSVIDQNSLDKLIKGLKIDQNFSADFCDQIQKIYNTNNDEMKFAHINMNSINVSRLDHFINVSELRFSIALLWESFGNVADSS